MEGETMDSAKIYLLMSLIQGIRVEHDADELMNGLVEFLNSLEERNYEALGDRDGIIINDDYGSPLLAIMYSKNILKFSQISAPEDEEEFAKHAGFMLLNIIAFLRTLEGIEFRPAGIDSVVGLEEVVKVKSDDWCL